MTIKPLKAFVLFALAELAYGPPARHWSLDWDQRRGVRVTPFGRAA